MMSWTGRHSIYGKFQFALKRDDSRGCHGNGAIWYIAEFQFALKRDDSRGKAAQTSRKGSRKGFNSR